MKSEQRIKLTGKEVAVDFYLLLGWRSDGCGVVWPVSFRVKHTGAYADLQIVESFREASQVRQRVLADRGRYEDVTPERQSAKDPLPLKVKGTSLQTIEDGSESTWLTQPSPALCKHSGKRWPQGDGELNARR